METSNKRGVTITLIIFSIIFFGWGLLTSLNGVLVGHLNSIFNLSGLRGQLINFTFFATYFFVSFIFFTISKKRDLLNYIGYKYLTLIGLTISALGSYLFYPASAFLSFPFFLIALTVLAAGITLLQISANSYIVKLGSQEQSASRLTIVQTLNSVGSTMGPLTGSALMAGTVSIAPESFALLDPEQIDAVKTIQGIAVQLPYWIIATSLFLLASLIFFLPMPDVTGSGSDKMDSEEQKMKPNILLGTIGIFMYVGGEVSIGTNLGMLIDTYAPTLVKDKDFLISSYWGLALVGRFIGGLALRAFNNGRMLAVFAAITVALVLTSIVTGGELSIYCLVVIGFFNSIMFPSIFAFGLHNLKAFTGKGASLLIMAIAGGAFVPAIYTLLSGVIGAKASLLLVAGCYFYIAYYGRFYEKLSDSNLEDQSDANLVSTHHSSVTGEYLTMSKDNKI